MSETLVGGWKKLGNPGKKQQFVASTKLYIFRWFASSYHQNGYKMVFSDGLPNDDDIRETCVGWLESLHGTIVKRGVSFEEGYLPLT